MLDHKLLALQNSLTNRTEANTTLEQDNTTFQFWHAPVGSRSVIRFLPDSDETQLRFWVERSMIRIPFTSKNGKNFFIAVPSMEMWNETDPIQEIIKPMWKVPEQKRIAQTYYARKSYIMQGFVVSTDYREAFTPENPIRRFVFNADLYKRMLKGLNDLTHMPTDYTNGTDFEIVTSQNGGYKAYNSSAWHRRTRPISAMENLALSTYKLNTLANWLPKKPTEEELATHVEMFEASMNGEPYDIQRWGLYVTQLQGDE